MEAANQLNLTTDEEKMKSTIVDDDGNATTEAEADTIADTDTKAAAAVATEDGVEADADGEEEQPVTATAETENVFNANAITENEVETDAEKQPIVAAEIDNDNAANANANAPVDANATNLNTSSSSSSINSVTVTVTKSSPQEKLGIGIAQIIIPTAPPLSAMKITSIADTSLFRDTELSVGMIILTINGMAYSDFDHGSELLRAVGDSCQIRAAFPFPPKRNNNLESTANAADDDNNNDDEKGRKPYKCGKCGAPKKGHVCHSQGTNNAESISSTMQPAVDNFNWQLHAMQTAANFNFYGNPLLQASYANALMRYAAQTNANAMMQQTVSNNANTATGTLSAAATTTTTFNNIAGKKTATATTTPTSNGNSNLETRTTAAAATSTTTSNDKADGAEKNMDYRKRNRIAVAELLNKRMKYYEGDYTDWGEAHSVTAHTTRNDAESLQVAVYAISRSDPTRAAGAIVKFLDNKANVAIRKEVLAAMKDDSPEQILQRQIIKGLKKSIAHHTNDKGGTRTAAAETFVKNVVTASVFHIASKDGGSEKKVPAQQLKHMIGATRRQVDNALELAKSLVNDNTHITFIQRKARCDKIVDKLTPFIFDFLLDDEYTRVCPEARRQKKPCEVVDPRTGEKRIVTKRIWRKQEEKFQQFLESQHYHDFQEANEQKTIGASTFRTTVEDVGASFMVNPLKPKSEYRSYSSSGQQQKQHQQPQPQYSGSPYQMDHYESFR
jgi:hypothetical protein